MSDPKCSAAMARNIALIAVPLVIALVVALLVIRSRDDGGSAGDQKVTGTTTSSTVVASTPELEQFCDDAGQVRRTIETMAAELGDPAQASPQQVADILEAIDTSVFDPAKAPAEIREDLEYVIANQATAVKTLRDAGPDVRLVDVLPEELVKRFIGVADYANTVCGVGS